MLNRRRWLFLFFCLALTLAVGLLWQWSTSVDGRTPASVVLAPWLATLGWSTTVYMTRSNDRRKHTIDLILRHQMDRTIEDHRYRVLAAYPPFTKIDEATALILHQEYRGWTLRAKGSGTDVVPVGYSVIQVLNFYEFIAVNVRRERLDERTAFDSFRALTKNMVDKLQHFIRLSRKAGDDGNRPTTFQDLVWLTKRWHDIDLDA